MDRCEVYVSPRSRLSLGGSGKPTLRTRNGIQTGHTRSRRIHDAHWYDPDVPVHFPKSNKAWGLRSRVVHILQPVQRGQLVRMSADNGLQKLLVLRISQVSASGVRGP